MSMCVAMLIAAEFMPVSLLTPIAADLGASAGMAGQAFVPDSEVAAAGARHGHCCYGAYRECAVGGRCHHDCLGCAEFGASGGMVYLAEQSGQRRARQRWWADGQPSNLPSCSAQRLASCC